MANKTLTHEERIQHADRLIEYYRNLDGRHSFRLGFYMAKQWRKYLLQDQHDINELRDFANALENGADMHGSGWLDLTLGVRWWLVDLESAEEKL